uniref:golgin subfamily A member 6-like protein 24 n=1 Tax=Semicossyphus pulcher TaxID=241346 RepID=UPI0037E8F147
MEVEPTFNFYLSSLEAQARSELRDNEARVHQSTTQGRVLLEIEEDSLANLLDQLQGQNENMQWSCEREEELQREISSLKAQLQQVQPKPSAQRVEDAVLSELKRVRASLRKTCIDLEMEHYKNQDLQKQLEKVLSAPRDDNGLKSELKKVRASLQKTNTDLELEHLKNQDLQVQLEKVLSAPREDNRLQSELKKVRASLRKTSIEIEMQYYENQDLHVQLKKMKEESEALQKKMKQELSEMEEALLKQKEDAKKAVEKSQLSHQAQQVRYRAYVKNLSELKEEKNLLENQQQQERSHHREEMEKTTASCVSKVHYQRHKNKKLTSALKEAEKKLNKQLVKWDKEKSTLLKTTEKLRRCLQKKEQQWEKKESSMRSQLTDLQRQNSSPASIS